MCPKGKRCLAATSTDGSESLHFHPRPGIHLLIRVLPQQTATQYCIVALQGASPPHSSLISSFELSFLCSRTLCRFKTVLPPDCLLDTIWVRPFLSFDTLLLTLSSSAGLCARNTVDPRRDEMARAVHGQLRSRDAVRLSLSLSLRSPTPPDPPFSPQLQLILHHLEAFRARNPALPPSSTTLLPFRPYLKIVFLPPRSRPPRPDLLDPFSLRPPPGSFLPRLTLPYNLLHARRRLRPDLSSSFF